MEHHHINISIHLLGRFEVVADGEVILDRTWNRRKARALLNLLALQRGHSLHRDQMLDALWPDLEPAAAANNLHKNLHYLRAALAAKGVTQPVIEVVGEVVRLCDDVQVDADVFRQLGQQARASDGDPDAYEEALEKYAGDLLPEDLYEDWAAPRREELRALSIELLCELSQLYETHGQVDLAIERLRHVIETDPLHEAAHRALMRLYARSGSRHRALRQYQLCRDLLARELDVEPAQDTEVLYRQILAGELEPVPVPAGVIASGQAPPRRPALAPFFGRERELEYAQDLIDASVAGQGTALVVGGAGGIGKTSFVEQLIKSATDNGSLALTGRCYQFEASMAYQPLRDIIRQAVDGLPEETVSRLIHRSFHLKRLLPGVEIEPPPAADPALLRLELFNEIGRLLTGLAEYRPLILVIDDLHASDEASLRLFHFLCRQIAGHRILLLATFRSDETDPEHSLAQLLSSLKHERLAHELILGPLPDRVMPLLIEQGFSGMPVEHELVREVAELAEGNPFLAVELVQTFIQEGLARSSDGRWQRRAIDATPVPGAVHDMLDRRLRRLDDAARELVQVAAVLGRGFNYQALRANLDLPERVILDSLDDCIGAFILEEVPSGYQFRHELLREAVRGRLTRARRQQLHRAIGASLIEQVADLPVLDVGSIGYHFLESDEPWRGIAFIDTAARHAASVYANEQAIDLYERALAVINEYSARVDPSVHMSVLEGFADVLRRTGDVARSIPCYEKASTMASVAGDHDRTLRTRGKAALGHITQGDTAAATELLSATLQAMTEASPQLVVARTYYLLAQLRWHNAEYREALDAAEQALLAAESTGDVGQQAQAFEVLALACHALGDWQKGVEYELSRHALGVPGFDTDEAFDAHL